MAHNRYLELTDTQKVHVDRYINSIASGGATDITSAVMCCVDEARKAVTGLERQSDTVQKLAAGATSEARARVLSQRVAPAMQKNCSTVRHALAMIVDATVRPTL